MTDLPLPEELKQKVTKSLFELEANLGPLKGKMDNSISYINRAIKRIKHTQNYAGAEKDFERAMNLYDEGTSDYQRAQKLVLDTIVNERAKRATNERLNWATWENK